jgi:hypothetical protein
LIEHARCIRVFDEVTGASGGQIFTHTHFTDNIVRVGLNYQFH